MEELCILMTKKVEKVSNPCAPRDYHRPWWRPGLSSGSDHTMMLLYFLSFPSSLSPLSSRAGSYLFQTVQEASAPRIPLLLLDSHPVNAPLLFLLHKQ